MPTVKKIPPPPPVVPPPTYNIEGLLPDELCLVIDALQTRAIDLSRMRMTDRADSYNSLAIALNSELRKWSK